MLRSCLVLNGGLGLWMVLPGRGVVVGLGLGVGSVSVVVLGLDQGEEGRGRGGRVVECSFAAGVLGPSRGRPEVALGGGLVVAVAAA
jgi:hypothetical protein